jgi:hypothetical protein
MGLMDRIRSGLHRAREEATDLAQTTRIRVEIGSLNRRRSQVLETIGERILAMHAQGTAPAEIADLCGQVTALDQEIASKQSEIERINREPSG